MDLFKPPAKEFYSIPLETDQQPLLLTKIDYLNHIMEMTQQIPKFYTAPISIRC